MTDHELDVDTASRPAGPGIREGEVTDRWNTPNGTPNGGYLLAIALRGLAEDVDAPDPLVAAMSYLRPAVPGPVSLEQSVLRAGKRVTTAESTVSQDGRAVAHLVASFGDRSTSSGPSVELGAPPDLPPPDECLDPGLTAMSGPNGPMTIADRGVYRLASVPGWAQGRPSGDPTAQFWVRFADGRPVDRLALAFLVDAWPPAVAELGHLAAVTVQLTVHLHRVPVGPWVACRVTTRHLVDGYHEEDVEIWDEDGNLCALSRQLALVL
ncbi:thioesterase family protein [Solicola sp. PLA-1-18]|uniref:thioesterase family protein n=1 Tax=Solicola sp. PLA-1-18 TaxID=3380532 RepID=UPI003B81E2F2